jgi:small conductance mechanosensitive channel
LWARLLLRPFKIGDSISVSGSTGVVIEVTLFVTTLNTSDNLRIIIPNSAVYGATIKNFSTNEKRRIDIVVGISYSDDIGQAMDSIRAILAAEDRILQDPAPSVAVTELADSSVNIRVRPWVVSGDYGAVRGDLTRALKEGMEASGCSFPFPQQDLHLVSTPNSP